MTLSERSRSALYRRLSDLIHDEEAIGEMLSYFPSRDSDELATKDFVRAEVDAATNRILMWSVGANAALMSLALLLTRFG